MGTMGIALDYGGFGMESDPACGYYRNSRRVSRLQMKHKFHRDCRHLVTAGHETSFDDFLRDSAALRSRPRTISAVDLLMNAPFNE